ncbi:uncharacterized protein LOC142008717 [Carettochelys insculpta]|uniref:uncharacterized protein LOC142008717 n=1 Tax=Carettochelys insculpta TaxID=44489 RepID=UPI003EB762C5
MDTEPEVKKEKTEHRHPFYCNICKISCASALNLQTHFLGFKHKTVEEALKAHGIVKTVGGVEDQVKAPIKLPDYVQTEPEKIQGQTLEEQLNTCKDSEPALGLDYIIEYRSKENPLVFYECQLCHCQTGLSNMFMHVYGAKHRLAYLKKHHPDIAASDDVKGRGSELNRRLKQVAALIEKKEGRKQIKVVTDAPVMKRKWQEYMHHSKAKFQHVEASTSKEGKAESDADQTKQIQDSTQSLPSHDDTQEDQEESQKEELKPAEKKLNTNIADESKPSEKKLSSNIADESRPAEKKLNTNIADESSRGNKADENSKADKTKCDDSKQSKDKDQKAQVRRKNDDEIVFEEFTSHEELLGYLLSFEILSEDDASFILKVTQSLTNALVKYRQEVASAKRYRYSKRNKDLKLK